MAGETVIETAETNASETIDFITDPVQDAEFSEGAGAIDPLDKDASDSTEDFWEAFNDEEAESLTTVWVCDVSFDVPKQGVARDIFASTTKNKVVNRLFNIISSADLKEPCDFDVTKFTTKQQAIRAFFDGVEARNLFVGLVPVF